MNEETSWYWTSTELHEIAHLMKQSDRVPNQVDIHRALVQEIINLQLYIQMFLKDFSYIILQEILINLGNCNNRYNILLSKPNTFDSYLQK